MHPVIRIDGSCSQHHVFKNLWKQYFLHSTARPLPWMVLTHTQSRKLNEFTRMNLRSSGDLSIIRHEIKAPGRSGKKYRAAA